MTDARLRLKEPGRLAAVRASGLDGVEPCPELDQLAQLAAYAFDAPMSVVSLVTGERVWFNAHVGLESCEAPLDVSFCTNVVRDDGPFIVLNTVAAERYADHPLVVGEPYVRSYAGVPLRSPCGAVIGAVAIIDTSPRYKFDDHDVRALELVSATASNLIYANLPASIGEIDPLQSAAAL